MNIYGFHNFDYDDSVSLKVGHDQKFSKDEFETMVDKCHKEAEFLKKDSQDKLEKVLLVDVEDSDMRDDEFNYLLNMSSEHHFIGNVIELLKKNYGFIELETTYDYVFNGGNYVDGPKIINGVV